MQKVDAAGNSLPVLSPDPNAASAYCSAGTVECLTGGTNVNVNVNVPPPTPVTQVVVTGTTDNSVTFFTWTGILILVAAGLFVIVGSCLAWWCCCRKSKHGKSRNGTGKNQVSPDTHTNTNTNTNTAGAGAGVKPIYDRDSNVRYPLQYQLDALLKAGKITQAEYERSDQALDAPLRRMQELYEALEGGRITKDAYKTQVR
jgi:hypothetical protein